MRALQNKEDVFLLVHTFYQKIKQDKTLGPIFNKHIQAEQWPGHIDTLTNFWMTNLFGSQQPWGKPAKLAAEKQHLDMKANLGKLNSTISIKAYKGNPTQVHRAVDRAAKHSITPTHFGQWLNLWFATIDELFEGDCAIRAKNMARKMATRQYISIWKQRT